jgi:hypothetical protein
MKTNGAVNKKFKGGVTQGREIHNERNYKKLCVAKFSQSASDVHSNGFCIRGDRLCSKRLIAG